MTYTEVLIHSLGDQLLAHSMVLSNLDKEVPGNALMDFSRHAKKRGVQILSLLMLWALRQTFPSAPRH
ncbi:Uncharacterized protein FKW44_025019 [Caligus rogercresseyi]|uniref:Uncharacterized protein n=1 Tax=Caligus rogercresseyi TaxID=217165 RepID=A0A7T8GKQ6_CALRO|nr:Uncharacterized protein FKW44_025019 [Caligus rogercresseyi]